jgi:hypothetical protein
MILIRLFLPLRKHKSQLPSMEGISKVYGLVSQYWFIISLVTLFSNKGNRVTVRLYVLLKFLTR